MAIFNTEYFSTLDRGYYTPKMVEENQLTGAVPAGVEFPEGSDVPQTKLTAREIGATMRPNTYPLQELNAKIRSGAAKLEILFLGQGKSGFSGQSSTPEVLGKKEREEFRNLSKINDVRVTTHATPQRTGLSGFYNGNFQDSESQNTLNEINKAVEFAATATQGGAVVFHAGEWHRPIMDADVKGILTPENQRKFQDYETEWKKAPIYMADEATGEIKAFFTRESRFYVPADKWNEKTGMYDVELEKDGAPKVQVLTYSDAVKYFRERLEKSDPSLVKGKTDPEILLFGQYEQSLKNARGQALRATEDLDRLREQLNLATKRKETEEKIWDSTPESERWKLQDYDEATGQYKIRKDKFNELERQLKREIEGRQASAEAQQESYKQNMDTIKRFKPIEEVGIKRTADTLAKAGLKAMEETQRHRKELKEDIYIAPENLDTNYYGSTADEMIKIVQESRKVMAQKLQKKGISKDEAEKKAAAHIKSTLDTGHLNTWRNHFKGSDADFNKWYLEQVKKLVDSKVLGHIHLTDNWGYDDEHLTAGQGNAPIKETVKMLEKAGFKDFITETGSFNENTILSDTLAELGSPVYALGRQIPMGKFMNAHFGYAAPQNYIVGAYAPSNDFRLWSEVPLE